MFPLNRPEVMIAQAQNKFDDEGRLTDETTRKFIGDCSSLLPIGRGVSMPRRRNGDG